MESFVCILCSSAVTLTADDADAYRETIVEAVGPERDFQVCDECLPQALADTLTVIRGYGLQAGQLVLGEQN